MNDSTSNSPEGLFRDFFETILDFFPNLLTALLILILGILIAIGLEKISLRLFRALSIDTYSEKYGIKDILQRGGLQENASHLLSKATCWITILIFLIISLRSINLPTVSHLLSEFFLYLPNIFIALMILLIGYFLSNFLGRTALIAAVNSGFKLSGIIGKFVQFTVIFIAAAMSLEQLGIGKDTVIVAFSIIYGGVVLALALAFGLGGRNIARDYLEKRLKGNEEKDDIQHL